MLVCLLIWHIILHNRHRVKLYCNKINSFIYSFTQYSLKHLSLACVVLGTRIKAGNKRNNPCPHRPYIWVEVGDRPWVSRYVLFRKWNMLKENKGGTEGTVTGEWNLTLWIIFRADPEDKQGSEEREDVNHEDFGSRASGRRTNTCKGPGPGGLCGPSGTSAYSWLVFRKRNRKSGWLFSRFAPFCYCCHFSC